MAQIANTFESFDRVFRDAFDWYKKSPRHERERIAYTFRVQCRPYTRSHPRPASPHPRQTQVTLDYLHLVLKAVLPLFLPRYALLCAVPTIHILPATRFKLNTIARYRPSTNLICFNEKYLNRSASEIENTMKHELLHCWLYQHGFQQGFTDKDWHDTHFQAMAKYLGVKP